MEERSTAAQWRRAAGEGIFTAHVNPPLRVGAGSLGAGIRAACAPDSEKTNLHFVVDRPCLPRPSLRSRPRCAPPRASIGVRSWSSIRRSKIARGRTTITMCRVRNHFRVGGRVNRGRTARRARGELPWPRSHRPLHYWGHGILTTHCHTQ
jgi:hypothetical protein